jgi:3-oxoacyl-[acyl-carrier-protein] synthase II
MGAEAVRIFITGVGLVTSVGETRDGTWAALMRGERGIRKIELFDTTGQRSSIGGVVQGVSLDDAPAGRGAAWSRSTVLAWVAAREAMAQARLQPGAPRFLGSSTPMRIGLVVGATTGGMFETEAHLAELHVDPDSRDALMEMLSHPLTSTSDCLSDTIGPFHRMRTLSSACSSGANALVIAANWLLAGEVDAVVAGGTDGLCRLTLSGFNALAALDPEPCRPFDRRRRGLNLGEGSGFLVLERDRDARARGVSPIAELAGWAIGSEAHHITNPEPSGHTAARVIRAALKHARIDPSQLDYVNAHGTGTPLNDPMEAAALSLALGDQVRRVAVSSSKAQIGHTLAAAGAIEAGITALSLQKQAMVPTVGLDEPDAACPLVHVAHKGRPARIRAAVSNSFGFGGMDSAVVLTEPELGPPREPRSRRVVVTGAATLTPSGLTGTKDSGSLLDAPLPEAGRTITVDLSQHLDVGRARRLDRPARLGALVVERAFNDAGVLVGPPVKETARERVGIVLGSSFGSVDASAAFMHRVFDKGPRFASPADFPNLVPSSPVGHVSIYLGVGGPVLLTADLAVSGESACAQAIELVESGEADAVAAGGYEEASDIVERRIAVLFERSGTEQRARAEGAGAVVFEAAESAEKRGARVVAEVVARMSWRSALTPEPLAALSAPQKLGEAVVILPRKDRRIDELLAASAWRDVPRRVCDRAGGEHDTLGAIAMAAATGALSSGRAREALVVGMAGGRGYAVRLVAP